MTDDRESTNRRGDARTDDAERTRAHTTMHDGGDLTRTDERTDDRTAASVTTDGGTARGGVGDGTIDGLRANVRLFWTLLRKELIITVRYPVNLGAGLVTLFLIFLLMLEGGRRLAPQAFSDSVGGLVVGYLVFTVAVTAYQSLASSIQSEASWGTLERLHMSPLGFGRVMLYQAFVRIVVSFLWTAVIFPVVLFISGESLAVDPVTIVPLAVLAVLPVLGVGMVFGGASVVYKRVSRVFQLFQFGLIALIAAPVEQVPWLRALPVVQANVLIGRAMREGVRLWELSPTALAIAIAVAVGYLAVGYVAFGLFVRRARKLGVMGDY